MILIKVFYGIGNIVGGPGASGRGRLGAPFKCLLYLKNTA